MDEFAIDLDKVLDDFEKSEDSVTTGKNKPSDVNSSLGLRSHTSLSYSSSQVEQSLYHYEQPAPSNNHHYNGGLNSYLRNQQLPAVEKIDLSEADFAASTSSFSVRSVTSVAADPNFVNSGPQGDKKISKPSYPSLYTSFGLENSSQIVNLKQDDTSKTVKPGVGVDVSVPVVFNGYVEPEEEEVLAVELPVESGLTEQSQIEIKLIPSSEVIDSTTSIPSASLKDNPETVAVNNVDHTPPKVNLSEDIADVPALIFSPIVEHSLSEVQEATLNPPKEDNTDNIVTGSLPWEALEAELDIKPKTTQTNITSESEVVSFDDLESVEVNPDELESYLKDLVDINFTTTTENIEHKEVKVEVKEVETIKESSPIKTQSEGTQVVGGARPKVKDNSRNPKQQILTETRVETSIVNKGDAINRVEIVDEKSDKIPKNDETEVKSDETDKIISEVSDITVNSKQTNSEQTQKEECDISTSSLTCSTDLSPSKESTKLKEDSQIIIDDLASLSDDIEENSYEESITESLETSNSKIIRPTSLNLPSPLMASQPQVVPAIVEESLVAVTTEATPSPELSETDSALPPSPEVSQAENGTTENHLNSEIEENKGAPVEEESLKEAASPAVEASETIEPNELEQPPEQSTETNPPVMDMNEYISELTEEEQLLGKIKPFWMPDEEAPNCLHCDVKFTVLKRRHHCRGCGKVLCAQCCSSKARISYLEDREARVCVPCLVILNKVAEVERLYSGSAPEERDRVPVEVIPRSVSPSPNHSPSIQSTDERDAAAGWIPNPNNPQDYCSQVSPLQQAQAYSSRPPPVVMVPVGVLKRGDKPKREPKQVMFSDGIRPGGDLTELDSAISPEPKIPSTRKTGISGRPQRRVLEKGSPVGQLRSPQHLQSPLRASSPSATSRRIKSRSGSGRVVIYDEEGPLPPIILPLPSIDLSETDDKLDSSKLLECLQDETSRPVIFALTKNLYVSIKLVKLDCCLQKQCWVFASRGLNCVGQDEVMVVLERQPNENSLPRDIFLLFTSLYDNASMGSSISELGHLLFPEGLLGSRDHGAFLFIRPTYQCLSKLHFPQSPYLVAVLLQKWEVPWAKVFPLRLMLRIGAEFRYYPCPLVSVRFRKPVYGEIGHTIMSVLADFRNYQYSLPTIPGVVVCMEDKKTTVSLPRNRYTQVCRVVASSNEHVLSFGAAFSIDADSHLVCVQDDDGNYQTQAINIQNTTRKVTGASFIVFSGALKSTTGLTAKSSIVEDGLLVQITPESMTALKSSFQQMKDFVIDCGQVGAVEPDERVILKWTDDDKNFNIGVRSVIDGRNLEGIQSIRIHNGTDYSSDRFLIRWTEVFFLSNENLNQRGEPTDPSKLADGVAQAFCLALVSHLPVLFEADLTKIGLRVTLDSEQVGYEVGSKEEPLPDLYMIDLDTSLIPVITNASSGNLDSGSLTLELVFHILRK